MMAAYVGVAETVGWHAAYLYEDEELPTDDEALLHTQGADDQRPGEDVRDELD
jgi:hypothetical protein